jgi:general secretion pathway protein G
MTTAVVRTATRRKAAGGFTLIELLVTLAILGVLACMTVPVAQVMRQREREQELRVALHEIRNAIDAYKAASKEGRIAKEAGATGYPTGLDVLVDGVKDQTAQLGNAATWGKRAYASEADDPQEGDDVYDVYSTSVGIGLNGIAYRKW